MTVHHETTQNFLKVMQDFPWTQPVPVSYRLYHDEQGHPLVYSMEDLPGSYIEVDQPTYIRASHQVRVVDGRLINIEPSPSVTRLYPNLDSGVCCDPRDVCVIVGSDRPHQRWRLGNNDRD